MSRILAFWQAVEEEKWGDNMLHHAEKGKVTV
jgi:hypothetical protein